MFQQLWFELILYRVLFHTNLQRKVGHTQIQVWNTYQNCCRHLNRNPSRNHFVVVVRHRYLLPTNRMSRYMSLSGNLKKTRKYDLDYAKFKFKSEKNILQKWLIWTPICYTNQSFRSQLPVCEPFFSAHLHHCYRRWMKYLCWRFGRSASIRDDRHPNTCSYRVSKSDQKWMGSYLSNGYFLEVIPIPGNRII